MSVVISELRALRADVEADVELERVDGNLGRGVYGYLGALVRLVEDGDRDPSRALNEGIPPRRPPPARPPRPPMEPVMPRVIPHEAMVFLRGALGDDGAIGIAVEGVDQTPAGPRVRFVVPRLRRARVNPQSAPDRDACAKLVSRMMALRWRDGPAPRPVPAESGLALMEAYPEIYDGPTETADGWHWLLAAVAELIQERGVPKGFVANQVKQKFGTLRFYYSTDGEGPPIGRIIGAAEWISGAVCEECGAPGSISPGGWIRTLCECHADAKRRR